MAQKSADVKRTEPKWGKKGAAEPSQGEAAAIQRDLEELEAKYGRKLFFAEDAAGAGTDATGAAKGGRSNEVPVPLFSRDAYDAVAETKMKLDNTSLGQKVLTTEDLEYLRRKQEQITRANYEVWLTRYFNPRDPAQMDLLRKINPDAMRKQEQVIEEQAEMQKELALMNLHGYPQNEKQAQLLFMISNGSVVPPAGPLWDFAKYRNEGRASADMIARGIFSPNKIYSGMMEASRGPLGGLSTVAAGNAAVHSMSTAGARSVLAGVWS